MCVLKKFGLNGLFSFLFLMIVSVTIAQAQLVVTNTNNDGDGSLRWAIQQANNAIGQSVVSFNIPGVSGEIHTIFPESSLPALTNSTILDATTQPGYSTGNPKIVLDGNETIVGSGITVRGDDSIVRGFSIVGFIGAQQGQGNGIFIDGGLDGSGGGHKIEANFLGILPDGTPKGNASTGIDILRSAVNIIGGRTAAVRNVISGNFEGVGLRGADINQIEGNFIGTNPAGDEAVGNRTNIVIWGASGNRIGGLQEGSGNVISGGTQIGIRILADPQDSSENNRIQGNLIGTSADGLSALPNFDGIVIKSRANNNIIGDDSESGRNIISGNFLYGIKFEGDSSSAPEISGNQILGNYIGLDRSGEALGNQVGIVFIGNVGENQIGVPSKASNIISGNTVNGIRVFNATGLKIQNNLIGVSPDGLSAIPNLINGIDLGGTGTLIGGTSADARNIISGNGSSGIRLVVFQGSSGPPTDNVIQGNFIGTNISGNLAIANESSGILLQSGSSNTIGGTDDGERNIISGNKESGISLTNSSVTENTISGNYIGLAPNGESGIGNGLSGVSITNAPANLISGNVISHNGQSFMAHGIEINFSGAAGNQIISNKIGTNSSGTLPIPNNGPGLFISSANTIVGGSTAEEGNIISGNTLDGILIANTQADASGTTIQNNLIGVGSDGITPMGNNRDGIVIFGSSNILIGGESGLMPAFQNIIAHNGRNGVSLQTESGEIPRFNGILGNSIYSNSARGIALGLAGRVPNDADDSDDGPNKLQNFPEIENIEYDDVGHAFDVTYVVPSAPANSAYPIRVEFFLTDGTTQGKTYLGSDLFEESEYLNFINNQTEKSITLSLLSTVEVPEEFFVTATATDSDLNTSEFSDTAPSTEPVAGVSYTVTNTNDSGEGSLRWAITEANSSTFRDTVRFDIDGAVPHIINIESQFGLFTNPIIIDATTQAGYDTQTAVPVIILNGSLIAENSAGFVFSGSTSGSTIRGLSIVGFPGNAISMGSDDNEVMGNYIGSLPDGTVSSNTGYGIYIEAGSNNMIGASGIENRNIISGNKSGINITQGATGNQIRNNLIGTSPSGESDAANSEDGIIITSSSANFVGGVEAGDRNIISANTRNGITIQGSDATGNLIFGNYIGVAIDGVTGLGNGIRGLRLFNSPGNVISNNVISHNGQIIVSAGINVFGEFAINNQILNNHIGTSADGNSALGNSGSGIILQTLGTSIIGNTISGNTNRGIFISSNQGTAGNSLISDNYIGVASDGLTALGNGTDGILIDQSSGNVIGGLTGDTGNIISGNTNNGVLIQGVNSMDNKIIGNYIGLDESASVKVANGIDGIRITSGSGNLIGSYDETERNIISGNNVYGIHIQGTSASGNNIIGNYIGLDDTGSNGIGNGSFGIYLFNAPENQIAENVISDNGQLVNAGGIHLIGAGSEGNSLKANKIGTDVIGNASIGNKGSGIQVRTSGSIIGGSNPADRNIISGNTAHGISIFSTDGTSGSNTILNNYIGIGADGETPLGNAFDGIYITGSNNNKIGEESGQTAISPNLIAYNGRNGITLEPFNAEIPLSNGILSNSIFSNNFRGIDLGLTGRTPNDADDSDHGPNKLQNYPEMSELDYVSEENRLDITYVVPSDPVNSSYPIRVEFFLSDDTDQGKTYLGFDLFEEGDYSAFVNDDIQKSIQLALAPDVELPEGFTLTATATDAEMNTSEFAETITFTVTVPPSIVILTSPEDGAQNVSVGPTLTWESADGAGTYTVQLSTTVDFDPLLVNESGLTATEYTASGLDHEAVHFWRVRATNQAGDGDWSEVRSFTTEEEPLSPPTVVTLTSPENGAESVSVDPTLIWETADGAGTYTVQLSVTADFDPILIDEGGLTSTEYSASGLDYETVYYWRVRASNQAGDGDWSEIWSFTTEEESLNPPTVVTLTAPQDGAENVSVEPTLSWEGAAGADTYTVQLAVTSGFDPVLVNESGLTTTEYAASGLDYETIYYWRVRANNQVGDGDWSEVWSFTTEADPDTPPPVGNYVVSTTSDDGEGSLRWAIQQANLSTTRDSITFNIAGSGPHTIQLLERLDSFIHPVVLDATGQPGFEAGKPAIILDGSDTSNSGLVLAVGSDTSEIRGFSIVGFTGPAIYILSKENKITSNFIGLLPDGTPKANASNGILINGISNQIGGENSIDRNIISGNGSAGIGITTGSDGTLVMNNFIGTSPDGLVAVGNQFGITISNSTNNIIGGSVASKRNIISGNERNGIRITLDATTGNTIEGNYIGLTKNGDVGLGNGESGIELSSPDNIITGNVISHNGQLRTGHGIRIIGENATNNQIKANRVGTAAGGMSAIGNTGSGIWVSAKQNLFGGDNPEDGNVISGNNSFGMFFSRSQTSPDNHVIRHNLIGVAADGISPLGNVNDGILIDGSNNVIGGETLTLGDTPAYPNTIAHNGRNGITITAVFSEIPYSNAILGNRIYGNTQHGIDLGSNGRTPNDADDSDDGPNKRQNFPVVSDVTESTVGDNLVLEISYTVPSSPTHSAYPLRVEFFLSDGDNQGKIYLGYDTFNESDFETEKTAVLEISSLSSIPGGTSLVSTATDNDGNTSHFSDTTEFTGPPGIATLISPGNGDSDVTVNPTLTWTPVAGATAYRVQVSVNSDFSSSVIDEAGLSESEFETSSLDFETEYFWRVQASNNSGEGDWSSIFSFTTEVEMITITKTETIDENGGVISDDVSGVELTFPEGAVSSSTEINFGIYNEIPDGATISGLLVSLTGPDSGPITFSEPVLIKVKYDPDNLPDGITEDNLKLLRYSEINKEWSELDTTVDTIEKTASAFTLGFSGFGAGLIEGDQTPPPVVILNTPENNSTGLTVNPTFTWLAASTADSYRLQVSQVDNFSSTLIDQSEISATEFEAGGLKYETVYYWRVRASNEAGDGDWSNTWSFTTEDEPSTSPGIVTLSSPEDGAVDVSVSPQLNWQELQNTDSYTLQVSVGSEFTSTVLNQSGIEDTFYQVTSLDMNAIYYWRVRGVNQAGNGEWSQAWSFTTGELSPPGALSLSSADNAPGLSWEPSSSGSVSGYNVYRGASPGTLELLAELNESSVSYTDGDVPQGGSFYAVTATGSGGSESGFTNAVSFFRVDLQAGSQWQLVSHAVSGAQADVSGSLVYGYDSVYRSEQILEQGHGYWIKDEGGAGYILAGPGATQLELDLKAGWNLVGGPTGALAVDDIVDPSAILTTTPVYGYNGTHYEQAGELMPGSGYWLFAESAGQVSMSLDLTPAAASSGKILAAALATNSNASAAAPEKDRLVVSSGGLSGELVIYGEPLTLDEKYRYLRPPLAPGQSLDVRTSEGFSAMYGPSSGLVITAAAYPVTLRLEASAQSASSYLLTGEDQSGATRQWPLGAGSEVVLTHLYERLSLQRVSPGELISETLLESGYPNPFNPSTNIRYRLAGQEQVLLEVYDLSGRRIATLVNQSQQPGAYMVPFDGSGLASGVYFVRLQAGGYTNIQKLTLIK